MSQSSRFPSYHEAKLEFERRYCREVLEASGGNVMTAARVAKKDRRGFYTLMYRTGIMARGASRPGRKPKRDLA